MENHSDISKNFVPYELALKLKELGFNEKCLGGYDKTKKWWYHPDSDVILDVPLWQQAFDYFREKHNLHCVIDEYENPKSWGYLINNDDLDEAFSFSSYKEARQACLEKLIELVEDGKNK